jgi:cytoskeletal protein CcmA (bactofilin family)
VAGVTLAPGAPGTADWTVITLHPDLQWGGQDVTWSADHAFAASVCIAGELYVDASMDVSGAANISGAVDITGNVDIVGDITISGDLKVATDFSLTGGMAVDGTSNLTGDVAVGGDFSADGTTVLQNTIIEGDVTFTFSGIAGETGPIFKVFGDWSTRAKTTIFQARTDGYVTTTNAGGNTIQLKTDSNANPTTIRTSSPNIATAGLQACPVKGGDYWCISTLGNPTVYWMPIGDNT